MPGLFSRFKSKDGSKSKKKGANNDLADSAPAKPQWEDAWTRKSVEPEEIHELIRGCTEELKSRALDLPFLLLPFRPTSDPSAVRTFVRHFFDQSHPPQGEALAQELRLVEPMVLSGVVKWCWSRIAGGIVGWDAYELFKVGEYDSNMARDSFKTFIPISVENGARQRIIFDYFDLLAAIAAHGKSNGLGGRKLSRMAAWWAFEQKDTGNGFEGGYNAWQSAADATSHLFFAYLRSLAPEQNLTGITMLPRSLQKLVQETEYPPQRPELMMSRTNKVVMIVENVSPTPFALLRRTNHFQYRDSDRALQEFASFEDPIQALTEECRRVLKAVSAANQSQVSSAKHSTSLREASWSRFEDIGFSSALVEDEIDDDSPLAKKPEPEGLKTSPSSGNNGLGRPTTPSWADFLSSGFLDDNQDRSNLLLPPDKVLPPLSTQTQNRQRSSQSHRPRLESDRDLDPGELASITFIDLDDAFWWVWMSSLAPEETAERKAAFGRCAVVETKIRSSRWLVMEEMVAGAAPEPQEGAYIAEKKGFFSWTRRGKTLGRRKSLGKPTEGRGDKKAPNTFGTSKTSIGPDTHAKIQAKAAQLRAAEDREKQEAIGAQRRGRGPDSVDKTTSVMTMQSNLVGEASAAMKWAKKYDKGAIKDAYMANSSAGRGTALSPVPTEDTNGHAEANGSFREAARTPEVPEKKLPEPEPKPAPPKPVETPVSPARKPVAAAPPAEPPISAAPPAPPAPPSPAPAPAKAPTPEPEPVVTEQQVSPEKTREPTPEPEPEPTPALPAKDEPKPEAETTNGAPATPAEPVASPVTEKPKDKLKEEKKKKGFRKLFSRKKAPKEEPSADIEATRKGSVATESSVPETPTPEVQEEERPDTPKASEANQPKDGAVDKKEEDEAKQEFARFDQGPLTDQPAFVGDDDDEGDATPPPIARRPPQRSDPEPPKEEHLSQTASPGVQDRWAQIRKNAAERSAQYQRPEEEASKKWQQSKPAGGNNDDDDTSGEETIESRVARIKARVAELTGSMEGVQGPGGAQAPASPGGSPSPKPAAATPAAQPEQS